MDQLNQLIIESDTAQTKSPKLSGEPDHLDDERIRKPKGKKIKKMRYNFDK